MGLGWSDYGARTYDGQLGRWHAADPMAAKYSSLTPYNYVGNHPIIVTDPDGRDFNISVTRDKQGDINGVNISSNIYIQGAGASAERAEELTDYAATNLPSKTVSNVSVSFNVRYKVFDAKTTRMRAGDNLITFNATPEQSTKDKKDSRSAMDGGERVIEKESFYITGNTGTIYGSGSENRTVLHETLHLLGLSDRYDDVGDSMNPERSKPHLGFGNQDTYVGNNIMSTVGGSIRLNTFQYQMYVNTARLQLPDFLLRDVAPGYNNYVDRDARSPFPYTPFEKGTNVHVPE